MNTVSSSFPPSGWGDRWILRLVRRTKLGMASSWGRPTLTRYSSPVSIAVCPGSSPQKGSSLKVIVSDVGGGSVKNGERHSLARIPLRWMIRECFKTDTGIIFDAHMLKFEAGMNIDAITEAPEALEPEARSWTKPESGSLLSTLTSGWSKLPPPPPPKRVFVSEAQEQLDDALSPIFDQLDEHAYWRPMEWMPCKLSPSIHHHLL
jgi:hypothetical protein